ncbi:haloacid dehalogenase-like hydrolase domain-containing 5 [Corythoichthys intestinalis]|uniref:haloacid dehalogenase-like hydrolase domain-containing 5 n=1 Tax=Corythoichthys intestinalis TaxID=161448 RepID=UPI0025A639A7|nr:haloacid dehalogenase-like hydrolase domain-containing 5 [Corythoichthys intestinalis]XP_061814000.1 haloacid dehalogenase-like hydrolase domain-containing 5 [Nerophis lumbriciformis]
MSVGLEKVPQVVMWSSQIRRTFRTAAASAQRIVGGGGSVGILLDVDGVLLRGGSVIPAARRAFGKLLDERRRFRFPVVFVTNAGSCQARQKAAQLSALLDVHISPAQVVLSYSPLEMLTKFHDKCVLVSGQGPITDIARTLGFKKVVSVEQLREQHPLLDMVDHNRTPATTSTTPVQTFSQIEAVLLLGEPVRWETNLQLLVDVLLTDGQPSSAYRRSPAQLPVIACNVDLLWMAEAPSPRFGHGMFLLCLESAYKKLTGRDLTYEALLGKPNLLTYQYAEHALALQNRNRRVGTIYAVGDNPMTDVYGANLFDRYLAQQHEQPPTQTAGDSETSAGARCRSVLVCTGVYEASSASTGESAFLHGHRDICGEEAGLARPDYVLDDVEAAVDLLLRHHL